MDFYCKTNLVKDLQMEAKKMEDELERWKDEVASARKTFYELNYYTTRQILVLRNELGKLKTSSPSTLSSQHGQVMALLKSISHELIPAVLKEVVTSHPLQDRASPVPRSKHASVSHVESEPLQNSVGQIETVAVEPAAEIPKKAQSHRLVSLSRESLSERQKQNFLNITYYGYSEMIALKAIEVVGNGDWNDHENWLKENADKYERGLEDGVKEEIEDSEDEDQSEYMSSESDTENTAVSDHMECKYFYFLSECFSLLHLQVYLLCKVLVPHYHRVNQQE